MVPLADVLAAIRGEAELPDRAVAITVDDAYRSVYEVGYPLLRGAACRSRSSSPPIRSMSVSPTS